MLFSDTVIAARKARAAAALAPLLKDDEVVLVHAGTPVQKPGGLDQTYPFLPHPNYYWLTGFRRPAGVSAFSKIDGWTDFVQPVTREEKVWEGSGESLPGTDLKEFDPWLAKKKFSRRFVLGQAAASLDLEPEKDEARVLDAFLATRRVKDAAEVALIENLAGIAHAGYRRVKEVLRPGMTERDVQLEYETAVLRHGSEKLPYETIVGAGSNAAVLHAIPTSRVITAGDLVLIDAGADIEDYCVDVTRVYTAGGNFSEKQAAIYDLVRRAQEASIALIRPGVEWRDVHLASARTIAAGLKDLGVLRCGVDEAIEREAIAVFFPHGVGHLVGLKVRDTGGRFNPYPKRYAGARLRVDLPLAEGYLVTVEPGLYFIDVLLSDAETRSTFQSQINWDEVAHWKGIGGVRLEDDILVTATGHRNLTAVIEK
jgi:Xaa-Pro dipeptidase